MANTRRKRFFPKDPVKPSEVVDRMYMHYPPLEDSSDDESEDSSEEDSTDDSASSIDESVPEDEVDPKQTMQNPNMFSGKWMLFYDNKHVSMARGMTEHDFMWQFTKRLVDKADSTKCEHAVCSTAYPSPYVADPQDSFGVILLFTNDYRDKQEVKRAADSIREVMHYPKNMFYKTDEATRAGIHRCFGDKFVSLYKHTPRNHLYERDPDILYDWHPVLFWR